MTHPPEPVPRRTYRLARLPEDQPQREEEKEAMGLFGKSKDDDSGRGKHAKGHNWVDCPSCQGRGEVKAKNPDDGWETCRVCKGKGQVK